MSCMTSEELNYIVFRYLQESGFTHAAFSLGYEAGINKSSIKGQEIPPATLVRLVQKGLQYIEMEANTSISNSDVDEDFTFVDSWDLMTKDIDELWRIVKDKKKSIRKGQAKEKSKNNEPAPILEQKHRCERESEIQEIKWKGGKTDKEKLEAEKLKEREKERGNQVDHHALESIRDQEDMMNIDESGVCEAFKVRRSKRPK